MRANVVLTGALLLLVACGHSDPKLNQRVENRLAEEGAPAGQVSVSSNDRIVRLDGVVASNEERERLDRAARAVSGVLAVDNRLAIQAPVGVTAATMDAPARVRNEVMHRLQTAGVDEVDVEQRGQMLVLRGHVSAAAHDAAIQAASAAAPEMSIEDQLTVAP